MFKENIETVERKTYVWEDEPVEPIRGGGFNGNTGALKFLGALVAIGVLAGLFWLVGVGITFIF